MSKPTKTAQEAQTEHEAMQRMGMSTHATKETQAVSAQHQGAKSFRKCPACKRINRKYEITD